MLGPQHAATLRSYYNVGKVQQKPRRPAEAEVDFRRALGGFRLAYGEARANTIAARTALSELLLEEKRYPETERMLLDERDVLANLTTPSARDRYRAVLGALVKFYSLWDEADPDGGHSAEAAHWQYVLDNSSLQEDRNHHDFKD